MRIPSPRDRTHQESIQIEHSTRFSLALTIVHRFATRFILLLQRSFPEPGHSHCVNTNSFQRAPLLKHDLNLRGISPSWSGFHFASILQSNGTAHGVTNTWTREGCHTNIKYGKLVTSLIHRALTEKLFVQHPNQGSTRRSAAESRFQTRGVRHD